MEAPGVEYSPVIAGIEVRVPSYCQYPSPSGGRHVWVDITDHATVGKPETGPLAHRDRGEGVDATKRFQLLAEIRGLSRTPDGAGAYAVIVGPGRPPLSPTFRPWKVTRGQFEALLQDIRDVDEKAAWLATQPAKTMTRTGVRPTGTTVSDVLLSSVQSGALTPLDLLPAGWEIVDQSGGRTYIRRPGGKSKISGNVLDGIFVLHSTGVDWATPGDGMTPAKSSPHPNTAAVARPPSMTWKPPPLAIRRRSPTGPNPSSMKSTGHAGTESQVEGRARRQRRREAEQLGPVRNAPPSGTSSPKADHDTEGEHASADGQDNANTDDEPTGPPQYWVSLDWVLTGQKPERQQPTYVPRDDGLALFYAGAVNGVFGDPETGKSWIAYAGAVQSLAAGERVAVVDADHNGADALVMRLLALGADPAAIADPDRFRYIEPDDGDHLAAAIRALVDWTPHYVVLDSLGEICPYSAPGPTTATT